MQNAIAMRHRIVKIARDYYDTNGFYEIETPFSSKSTPEGAATTWYPAVCSRAGSTLCPSPPSCISRFFDVLRLR